jgi:hypothetical protein
METETDSATPLSFAEARVLGCLIEKELTTPEYYPLTLGALTAACNQKSNRDPVVEWDEATVSAAADGLRRRRLAVMVQLSGARVPKYRHALHEVHGSLDEGMTAVLCELLLRNGQTTGELRTRAGRMHVFRDLEAVEACAARLAERQPEPLVTVLPPGAGRRVKAWAHLLCGPVEDKPQVVPAAAVPVEPGDDWRARTDLMESRIGALEETVTALRSELAALRAALGDA